MGPTERVGEQLNRAKIFHNYVIEEYPKRTYKGTLRNRLFIALCELELGHHGAVLTLVQTRLLKPQQASREGAPWLRRATRRRSTAMAVEHLHL